MVHLAVRSLLLSLAVISLLSASLAAAVTAGSGASGDGPSLAPPNPAVYRGRAEIPDSREPAAAPAGRLAGDFNLLVLLIEFQDVLHAAGNTAGYFSAELFNTTQNASSVYRYYMDNSYGSLQVTGEVTALWLTSAYTMEYYGADGAQGPDTKNGPIYRLVTEAVQKADATVDFSRFDHNRDGFVDHLCVVHSGQGQEASTNKNNIWSHRWEDFDEPVADGVRIRPYTMLSEYSPVGVFAHELAHDMGLPDLYDYGYDSFGVGSWDLMGSGAWADNGNTPVGLSAWCKYKLGWLTFQELTDSETKLSLPRVEDNAVAYRIMLHSPNEYFVIENRQQVGWDLYLPGSGMLIWHVDESRPDNDDQDHRMVDLEEADEAQNGDSAVQPTDPWSDSPNGFNPGSVPPSSLWGGEPSGWWVYSIGPSAPVMTFAVRKAGDDFEVSSLDFSAFAPERVPHNIRAVVTKLSGREAQDVRVVCTVSRNGAVFSDAVTLAGLRAPYQQTLSWNWTPPFAGNFIVTVRAEAERDAYLGNNERTGVIRAITLLFFDDVEQGERGWDAGANVHLLPELWHITNRTDQYGDARSPDHSWWCGYNATGQYIRGADFIEYYLESPTIDLSRVESAVLAFYTKYDISAGLPYGLGLLADSAALEVSSNLGGSWTRLDSFSGRSGDWTARFYDISQFTRTLFKFRFVLKSNTLLLGRGWYLDDLAVYATGNIYDVSLGISPNFTTATPGQPAYFNLTVSNAGNREDTFQLSWEATGPVSVSLNQSSLTLGLFETGRLMVAAGINGKAEAGSVLEIRIRAVSAGNPLVSGAVGAGMLVLQEFGVALEADSETVHADPDDAAVFRVNVTNSGNGPDLVRLQLGGKHADRAALERLNLTLRPWETFVVDVVLDVPGNASAGSELGLCLTARSSGGPSDRLTLKVVVNRTRGVRLSADLATLQARPGGHARFEVRMRNLGNSLESFILTSELPAGWQAAHDVAVPLAPFADTLLTVDVSVDAGSNGGVSTVFLQASAPGGASGSLTLRVEVIVPDLYLTGLRIEPQLSDEGSTVTVRVTVGNGGSGNATAVVVYLYDNGKKLKEWNMDRMPPGYSELLTFNLKLARGSHMLTVAVTTPDKELGSTNNQVGGDAKVRASSSFIPGFGALLLIAVLGAPAMFAARARLGSHK